MFGLYFKIGYEHIADFVGYDHILFLISLCGIYIIKQWKPVLILITAFTVGHTVTLVLATFNYIIIKTSIIEFLIPVTILITCIFNITYKKIDFSKRLHTIKYFSAMFFGLIHGMGFSNYLRSMLGREENLVTSLFAFNIGLELGQITIVLCILLLSWIFLQILKVNRREWNLVMSGAAGGVALLLIIERWPF
ncbi:MAG: HupE/UreJ family protein [Marinilabiliales bacterium]